MCFSISCNNNIRGVFYVVMWFADKHFDLGALLRNNEKKHKSKPSQFVSVSGGVSDFVLDYKFSVSNL